MPTVCLIVLTSLKISEWHDSQKKPSSKLRKFLQERIEKANARCRKELTREEQLKKLWELKISKMLATYFFEMSGLLQKLHLSKKVEGRVWIVVGNSQYAGVEVETGQILAEIARDIGFKVLRNEVIRKMRTSPQQGGTPRLDAAAESAAESHGR